MKPSAMEITVLRFWSKSKQAQWNNLVLAGARQQRETEETSILSTWLVLLSVN